MQGIEDQVGSDKCSFAALAVHQEGHWKEPPEGLKAMNRMPDNWYDVLVLDYPTMAQ